MKKGILIRTILLFIGYLILRLLGFYSINILSTYVGEEITSYTKCMIIYLFFLDVSSLGIFPSISRIISRKRNKEEVNYIINKAFKSLFIIGITIFFIFQFIILLNKNCYNFYYLEILSISFIFYPALFFLRGVNQGLLKPYNVLISVIIDALVRTSFILTGIFILKDPKILVVITTSGVTFGGLLSFIYLFKKRPKGETKKASFLQSLYLGGLQILPITMCISIYRLIDLISINMLNIPDLVLKNYLFKVDRLIMILPYLCGIFGSLYMPFLNTHHKKFKFFDVSAIVITIFFIFKIIATDIFKLVYKDESGINYFNYLLNAILYIMLIKVYTSELIRKRSIIISIIFILSFLLKFLLNLLYGNMYHIEGLMNSSYVTYLLLLISIIIYLLIRKRISLYDFSKTLTFLLISILLKGVLQIVLDVNKFNLLIIFSILISILFYLYKRPYKKCLKI